MRTRTVKKLLSAAASVLALTVMLTACSGGDKTGKNPDGKSGGDSVSKSDGILNPLGQLPLVKEKLTLTVAMPKPAAVEDMATNFHTQWMEKQTNIHLDFSFFSIQEAAQKLEILIASGDKLPDMLLAFGLNDIAVYKYGSSGAFVDLNPYYEKQSVHIKKAFEAADYDMKKTLTSPDGKMYSVGRLQEETHVEYSAKYYMNGNWLNKLGLEEPKTTEDLYNVLKAFKERDPNGNGKADEIPLVGGTGWNQNPSMYLMNSFIYNDTKDRWIVNNGKLDVAFNKPEWRDGLAFMNRLCSEGLLSPLSFTQDGTQLKQMIMNPNDVIVGGFTTGGYGSNFDPQSERVNMYKGIGPVAGPKGVAYSPYFPSLPSNAGHVTKDCKNPEAAFAWLDYCWDYDASTRSRYGEPGVDWREAKPGDKGYLEYLGYKPKRVSLLDGSVVQNKWWNAQTPMCLNYDIVNGQIDLGEKIDLWRPVYEGLGKMVDKKPKEVVMKIIYTPEEIDQIADIKNAINSYVNESIARFAVGDLNIKTDWDSYVKEIEKMGLKKYIEVSQKAYDRSK